MSTKGKTFRRKTYAPSLGKQDGAKTAGMVRLDHDVYRAVSEMAWNNEISFSEQAERLILKALEDVTRPGAGTLQKILGPDVKPLASMTLRARRPIPYAGKERQKPFDDFMED